MIICIFKLLPSNPPAPETVDGDYAWTARENLRKKVVGKEVFFQVENMESRNCSFGVVFLGTDDSGENLTEWSVSSGNCKLRDTVIKQAENQKNREAQAEAKGETYEGGNNNLQKLIDLQEKAQMEKVGRWSDDKESQRYFYILIKNICWEKNFKNPNILSFLIFKVCKMDVSLTINICRNFTIEFIIFCEFLFSNSFKFCFYHVRILTVDAAFYAENGLKLQRSIIRFLDHDLSDNFSCV